MASGSRDAHLNAAVSLAETAVSVVAARVANADIETLEGTSDRGSTGTVTILLCRFHSLDAETAAATLIRGHEDMPAILLSTQTTVDPRRQRSVTFVFQPRNQDTWTLRIVISDDNQGALLAAELQFRTEPS